MRCKGEEKDARAQGRTVCNLQAQEVQTKQGELDFPHSLILSFIFASCLAFALHCVLQLLPRRGKQLRNVASACSFPSSLSAHGLGVSVAWAGCLVHLLLSLVFSILLCF
ncbi:hypothetical protein H0G86_006474 [Trichoderma simmonsii]|uniref:Uncharacterized protein n=1 Tax=Trichoderma simmonsii TaxID=1491479 RepID=A0A8G0LBL1_9HYPO|nr:hypothetical protein H0G86_006474 [Trichoderma simmonsii]